MLGLFIFVSGLCHAQFSREQAKNLVINQLLVGELDHINVYLAKAPKSGQNGFTMANSQTISYPFDSNWVFFIDDDPYAGWAHPCRYSFINTETGELFTTNKTFFPEGLKNNFELISSIPSNNSVSLPRNSNYVPAMVQQNQHLYAVIISGSGDQIFWNDVSAVYSTLTKYYGFNKQNIFVHFFNGPSLDINNDLDGDGDSTDIDYDADKGTIGTTFHALAYGDSPLGIPKLGPEDALFVFVSDHGDTLNGHSFICLPGSDQLYDNELSDSVKDINCSQMIFLMAQCFSGGFIDDLMNFTGNPKCKNRYIYTAAKANEKSHREIWLTGDTIDNDDNGYFFEFVYYWTAAARGFYPDKHEPWTNTIIEVGKFPFATGYNKDAKPHSPDWNPDTDELRGGNNDFAFQMREVFNYADSMDSWSPNGYHCLNPHVSNNDYHDETPQSSESLINGNGGFADNVVGLTGLAGKMNTSQNVPGDRNYLFGGDFVVDNGKTLSIGQNANLYLKKDIFVNGGINLATNIKISGSHVYGLHLNYQVGSTQLDHIWFNGAILWNDSYHLVVSNCIFDDVGMSEDNIYGIFSTSPHGITISQSDFTGASLFLKNPDPD